VLEELGRGGMAVVFKAQQTSLDRIVALKIMSQRLAADPDFVRRFEREAKALASLNHPNITSIYDRGQAGKRIFFVMEFVEGHCLRDILQSCGGKIPQERALHLFIQTAEALSYVHARGTIHRDIKPENVLVTAEDKVKVTDFGLAAMANRNVNFNLTADNMMMGTLNYMPPEQRADAKSVDHRADIYSYGVMLYEMLTGNVPLGKWDPASLVVPGLDPRFDEIIGNCLKNNRNERYQSIDLARDALKAIQNGPGLAVELNIPLMGAELPNQPIPQPAITPPSSPQSTPPKTSVPRQISNPGSSASDALDLEALVAQAKRNMVAQRTRGLPTKVHDLPGITPRKSRANLFFGSLLAMLVTLLGAYFAFEGTVLVHLLVQTSRERLEKVENTSFRQSLAKLRSWAQRRARSLCTHNPKTFLPPLNTSNPELIRVSLVILSRGQDAFAATMAGSQLYSKSDDIFGWAVRALQYMAVHNPQKSEISETAITLLQQAKVGTSSKRVSFIKGVLAKIQEELQSKGVESG
jgi:serine/threonine protein kinase